MLLHVKWGLTVLIWFNLFKFTPFTEHTYSCEGKLQYVQKKLQSLVPLVSLLFVEEYF